MTKRIGIDVGGTFTDFVMLDRVSGDLVHHKEPSTPADPAAAVASGIRTLVGLANAQPTDVELIVHGTTLSLNALLQRKGVKVALLTSQGAKDILELARIRMAQAYDFFAAPEKPMVKRHHVLECDARIATDGTVVGMPDAAQLDTIATALRAMDVEVVVISIINGYANKASESALAASLRERLCNMPVVAATDIWPEIREYERTMIAVMNGYVEPIMHHYYDRLESLLGEQGFVCPLSITASNGGTIDLATARARPIDTILSGPAAGVVAAALTAETNAIDHIVTFDMGGTSADIAVIERGTPDLTTETMIGEIPLILPVVNVSAIGAGGGSIIHVDEQGMLKVGPASAGAAPGPACYGRGGTAPTITDCYLLCGFLDGATFLGGRLPLSIDRARAAMASVADALGYRDRPDPEAAAAEAALRVASSMMATEVRKLLARRGSDIRDFTLVPYGGAGATHAALLADEASLTQILVPRTPATFCALGAIVAKLRRDFVRSCRLELLPTHAAEVCVASVSSSVQSSALAPSAPSTFQSTLDELLAEARSWMQSLGSRADAWRIAVAADLRYPGQAFDLSIELPGEASTDAAVVSAALRAAFESKHTHLYGFHNPSAPVELARLVISGIGALSRVETRSARANPADARQAVQSPAREAAKTPHVTRRIFVQGTWRDVPYLHRTAIPPGVPFAGPAIVEQSDTTALVPDGWTVQCQDSGDLLLRRTAPHSRA